MEEIKERLEAIEKAILLLSAGIPEDLWNSSSRDLKELRSLLELIQEALGR